MRQLARVTMTMRDLDRLKCIQAVVDGNLKPGRAAERLGLTTRQVRRLTRRYALAMTSFGLAACELPGDLVFEGLAAIARHARLIDTP